MLSTGFQLNSQSEKTDGPPDDSAAFALREDSSFNSMAE
jgi:hypothetical protein